MTGRVRVSFRPKNGAYDMFAQVVHKNSSQGGRPNTLLQYLTGMEDNCDNHYHIGGTAIRVYVRGECFCVAYASNVDRALENLGELEKLTGCSIEVAEAKVLVEDEK